MIYFKYRFGFFKYKTQQHILAVWYDENSTSNAQADFLIPRGYFTFLMDLSKDLFTVSNNIGGDGYREWGYYGLTE